MSTILPLPSSPYCAPSTAMLVFDIGLYSITKPHRGRRSQLCALDDRTDLLVAMNVNPNILWKAIDTVARDP
jgi:hypothetical protein